MAQMTIESTSGFSYNGTGDNAPIATFRNPSNSERAEISSLVIYLGSVRGTCTWGTIAYGDGGPFSTYVTINSVRSSSVTVNNTVGTYTGRGGVTPDLGGTRAYTFTFSSPVSVAAGSSATIYIQTPSTSNSKVMAFNGRTTYINGNHNPDGRAMTLTYTNIPNIAPAPSSVKIQCTDYDANSITWKVTVSGSVTNYEIYRDNNRVSTQSTTSKTLTGTMTGVSSSFHNIYARAKNSNSAWVDSNVVTVDCTRPPINNASIRVITRNQGILNFTSTYQVQYLLNNTLLGTVNANTSPNATVNLNSNSISNYLLEVKRNDNKKINNTLTLKNVDSTVASITLNLTVEGMQVNYNARASKSCRAWQYRVLDERYVQVKSGTITNSTVTQVSSYLTGLEVNKKYYLQVAAVTQSSGLATESNMVQFELKGCSRIWDGNEWTVGIAYVYDNDQWKQVIPYVWNGNEWVVCV